MTKGCAIPQSKFPLKFKVKSPVHALELARELIAPFENWTTGQLAEDSNGNLVGTKEATAAAFCAVGALKRVNTKHEFAATLFLQSAAAEINKNSFSIIHVNDGGRNRKTHARVLRMFTRAIELAKEEGRE